MMSVRGTTVIHPSRILMNRTRTARRSPLSRCPRSPVLQRSPPVKPQRPVHADRGAPQCRYVRVERTATPTFGTASMCASAVLVGIGNTLPGRSNADTDMVRDGTYRMLRKVADRAFEEAAFRDIARLESRGPAADAILSYRLHRSGASSRATADDPRQLVERRPRLTPRRPELTEDGGDRRPLLEQRLAGLEQALGVGTGQRAADGQRSRNPSTPSSRTASIVANGCTPPRVVMGPGGG
jgi:hypothetical protein